MDGEQVEEPQLQIQQGLKMEPQIQEEVLVEDLVVITLVDQE